MEIKIVVDEINYGDLAEQLLPYLVQRVGGEEMLGGMVSSLAKMPSALARSLVDALPREKKDELAAFLINKNRDRILRKAEKLAGEQHIRVRLSDLKAIL